MQLIGNIGYLSLSHTKSIIKEIWDNDSWLAAEHLI